MHGDVKLVGGDRENKGVPFVYMAMGEAGVWAPIIDTATDGMLEYNPLSDFYGLGINKNAAHVICK